MTPKTREQQAREIAENIVKDFLEHGFHDCLRNDITRELLSFPSAEAVSEDTLADLAMDTYKDWANDCVDLDAQIKRDAFAAGFRAGQKKMEGKDNAS